MLFQKIEKKTLIKSCLQVRFSCKVAYCAKIADKNPNGGLYSMMVIWCVSGELKHLALHAMRH